MYKIGITGSIGSGKTTVANMFSFFNIPVFDADLEIKKILTKNEINKKIKSIWPLAIKEKYIDKSKLREIIFSNKKEKKKLERLLYPYLEVERKKFERANCKKEILIYDVPLIYETKSEKKYDKILLVYCDTEIQEKRVLMRDSISKSLFIKILASQLDFNEKIKYKPHVINTNNFKFFIFIRVFLLLIKILIMLRFREWKKGS